MTASPKSIAASPTAIAIITIASALAISLALRRSNRKSMCDKGGETAAAAAAAVAASDPELPNPNFAVGSFRNSRSQSLFTLHLPRKDASSPAAAMLVLVHGVAEHCCRAGYVGLYESLSEAGVDCYSMDLHGHGRSEGEPRGYVEDFGHYVADVLEYMQRCQQEYKDRGDACPPLVLMGQSMGALISVLTVMRLGSYHVGGIILTSPALGVDMNLKLKVQKMFAPLIDKHLPKSNIVDGVRPKDMSRNPEAVQAYIDDPLCIKGKLVARTAIRMSRSFGVVRERRGEITCPTLIMHGTGDRCTSVNASRDFFRHIGTSKANKKFLQLPGMYHELLEEPESDLLMISIIGFASSGGKQFVDDIEGEENDGVVNVALEK